MYSTQILYFNSIIFRLEHLSLEENNVKHIHFQDHIQKINALQQSCIIYLYFLFLADLNSLHTIFAEHTCYLFFTAQKMKFSIEGFFSKCDQIHKKPFFEESLSGKLHFLCNICLLKSVVKNLVKFNTTALKQSSFIYLIIALM